MSHDLENLKASVNEKDKKIKILSTENQKLHGEFSLQKKMCKCASNANKDKAKIPMAHTLQRQLTIKTLEFDKLTEVYNNKCLDYKKLEADFIGERTRLTDITTELYKDIARLKSKCTSLEETLSQKDELVEKIKKTQKEFSQRTMDFERDLANKSDIIGVLERSNIK